MTAGPEQAADILAVARETGEVVRALPEHLRPLDEDGAYDIQRALHRRLSGSGTFGSRVGYKIGCTTPVMQEFLAIDHPCAGGVFGRTTQEMHGRVAHADFRRPGVECELAVRLATDLPAEGAPYDRERVGQAVGACMAAIELVDDRYLDFTALGAPTLTADDFFGAGCVLGAPVEDWPGIDLAAVGGRMSIDGEEVGRGTGGDILGHPLNALAWLANSRARRGEGLLAGEFVLLGSVVAPQWVDAGAEVHIEFEAFGEVALSFQ